MITLALGFLAGWLFSIVLTELGVGTWPRRRPPEYTPKIG